MKGALFVIFLLSTLTNGAVAHPEKSTEDQILREVKERTAQHIEASQSIAECSNSIEAQALRTRAAARRAAKTAQLREERGLLDSKFYPPHPVADTDDNR